MHDNTCKTNHYNHLLSDPAVEDAVLTKFSNTYYIYYICHISQNLPKRLKGEFGSNFSNFMKDFFKTRNSLTKT